MKRIDEEIRLIRQQMEEDFLLHSERIEAQQQAVGRVEQALEAMGDELTSVIVRARDAVGQFRLEFREFALTTRSYQETWASERRRNLRMLDVIQTGLLTGGLETEARLDKVEGRLTRLEDKQSGAA